MYALLLAVGLHHREMIQRKSLNYERILNVEIEKTNNLISKLVPLHILTVIKNEKKQVDEFDDVTLLFTDMVGFTAFSKNVKDPRDVVNLLSKLFSRFDQLCEEHKVYKVHTIGDCYVIMGYNGRIDKNKRVRNVVIDEAHRVIQSGLEMIDIIKEVRESSDDPTIQQLDMRIGVHTGKVVAGIIGSKVVRYDIFGEGVLIANKMESNGIGGKVCVSEETKKLIQMQPDLYNEYLFEDHSTINLSSIGKTIKSFIATRKDNDSLGSGMLGSQYNSGNNNQEDESDKKEDQSKITDRIDEESDEEDSDEKKSNS